MKAEGVQVYMWCLKHTNGQKSTYGKTTFQISILVKEVGDQCKTDKPLTPAEDVKNINETFEILMTTGLRGDFQNIRNRASNIHHLSDIPK